MICADDVIRLLLSACPSFQADWAEIEDDDTYLADDGGRLNYIDAGEFIRHLVQLRLDGRTDSFPAVFEVIERMVTEGDDYVRNLGVIGYVEGLQMRTVTESGLDPEAEFRPLLGPASLRWWIRINAFWAGDASAVQVHDP